MSKEKKVSKSKWNKPFDLTKWDKHRKGYGIDGCAVLSESNFVVVLRKDGRTKKSLI